MIVLIKSLERSNFLISSAPHPEEGKKIQGVAGAGRKERNYLDRMHFVDPWSVVQTVSSESDLQGL